MLISKRQGEGVGQRGIGEKHSVECTNERRMAKQQAAAKDLAVSRLGVKGGFTGAVLRHVSVGGLGVEVVEVQGVLAHDLAQLVVRVSLLAHLRAGSVKHVKGIIIPVGEFATVHFIVKVLKQASSLPNVAHKHAAHHGAAHSGLAIASGVVPGTTGRRRPFNKTRAQAGQRALPPVVILHDHGHINRLHALLGGFVVNFRGAEAAGAKAVVPSLQEHHFNGIRGQAANQGDSGLKEIPLQAVTPVRGQAREVLGGGVQPSVQPAANERCEVGGTPQEGTAAAASLTCCSSRSSIPRWIGKRPQQRPHQTWQSISH